MTDEALIREAAVPTTWREQYERMLRWRGRLWLGVEHLVARDDQGAVDAFYAFAQSCYHLVDWLDNDRSQHVRRTHAEAYVESRPILALCRDICNGSKHAQLHAKKVDVRMRKTTTSHSVEDEEGQPFEFVVRNVEVFIRWGGAFVGADDFAAQCIGEWDHFLRGEGLLP
jgi:hypothetical protein